MLAFEVAAFLLSSICLNGQENIIHLNNMKLINMYSYHHLQTCTPKKYFIIQDLQSIADQLILGAPLAGCDSLLTYRLVP